MKRDEHLATPRHVPIVLPRRASGSISAGDAAFAWSSSSACVFFVPGYCGSSARVATGRLPTIRPFALRRKQFVSPTVLERAKDFLGSRKSYRQGVREQQRSLVYDDRQEHPLAARGAALAHSTLWRWLSWLGGRTRTMQRASQLICQQDPHSTFTQPCDRHRSPKVSFRGASSQTGTSGPDAAGGGHIPGAFRQEDLPPVCNRLWLAVS